MIIDSHTHLGLMNDHLFTSDELLQSMRKAGVDYSFVIADRIDNSGLSTDETIAMTKNSQALKAIGNVEINNFDQNQLKKLCDYLTNKKIIGIKLYLGYESFYSYDKRLFPLYQFCSDNRYPVIYHTGVLEVGYHGVLKYAHPLTVDEVAVQFPHLNIIIAHMGNPWIMDCAAVMLKNKNVYADISGFFDEYQPIKSNQKNFFINKMREFAQFTGGFTRCLFGTDWPLYDQKEYLDAFYQVNLTQEEQELTLWKNAMKLFNLNQ